MRPQLFILVVRKYPKGGILKNEDVRVVWRTVYQGGTGLNRSKVHSVNRRNLESKEYTFHSSNLILVLPIDHRIPVIRPVVYKQSECLHIHTNFNKRLYIISSIKSIVESEPRTRRGLCSLVTVVQDRTVLQSAVHCRRRGNGDPVWKVLWYQERVTRVTRSPNRYTGDLRRRKWWERDRRENRDYKSKGHTNK